MHIGFDAYWPLLFLLMIPYLRWVQRKSATDLSIKQLHLLTTVRSTIVALVVLALMQPVIYRSGASLSLVYLIDVSQSISSTAIQSALQWIQQTNDSGRPAHARFIPFAANSMVFENLDQLRTVKADSKPVDGFIDQSATNIEGAVDMAIRNFAPHHLKRLVLITDGHENSGNITDMLPTLKQHGIQVYTVPSEERTNRDVWVETTTAPSEALGGELFTIKVLVYSELNTPAEVQVKYGDKTFGTRKVQLVVGLNDVAIDGSIKDETGPVTLEAEVKSADDTFLDNNKFRTSIVVQGPLRILYIEGRPSSARFLQSALYKEGLRVTTLEPPDIPTTLERLDVYDAILLSDVARNKLSDEQMRAMAAYVRDLGGGLILAGGENVYGEDGYSETAIEQVLPITFELKKPKPVAMVLVIDKSGSMRGIKMELTREATKAPVELLDAKDFFGVVAFNDAFAWAVPYQSVTNKGTIYGSIDRIVPEKDTNIYPALEAAYQQLAEDPTEIKHVILLSDGRSIEADFQSLAEKMSQAKITVSTVTVGTDADRKLLENIAIWGKGRAYFMESPSTVPQIFTQETQLAKGIALREDSFNPVMKKNVEAFKGIDFNTAPPLLGYVATRLKDSAEVLLESGSKDPILARWQYGLGKTAAFTSDLKNRWAANWLRWDGYSKFWSQLVRETMRPRGNSEFDLRVARNGNEAIVTINALRRDGQFRNKLEQQVTVVAPDQTVSIIAVHQVGPGSYEAKLPLTKRGSYLFRAVGATGGGSSRILDYSYPDEYHFYPPDTDLLQTISSETKGGFQPSAKDIFDPRGETTNLPTPLWPYLMAMSLVVYLTDVLLRRLRLFE